MLEDYYADSTPRPPRTTLFDRSQPDDTPVDAVVRACLELGRQNWNVSILSSNGQASRSHGKLWNTYASIYSSGRITWVMFNDKGDQPVPTTSVGFPVDWIERIDAFPGKIEVLIIIPVSNLRRGQ
jgi:hypothetical protein